MRAIITTLFKQYYTEFNRIINNFSCDILPTSKHRRSWERHRQRVPMESAVLEYPIMRKQTFSHSAQKSNSRICLQPRCSQQFLRAHSPSFCNRRRSKAEYLWRIAHGDAVSLYICCALVFWQWSAQIVLASASKATGNISANNLWRRPPVIIWQRLRPQKISFHRVHSIERPPFLAPYSVYGVAEQADKIEIVQRQSGALRRSSWQWAQRLLKEFKKNSFIWSNDTLWMCSSLPKALIASFHFPCAWGIVLWREQQNLSHIRSCLKNTILPQKSEAFKLQLWNQKAWIDWQRMGSNQANADVR